MDRVMRGLVEMHVKEGRAVSLAGSYMYNQADFFTVLQGACDWCSSH